MLQNLSFIFDNAFVRKISIKINYDTRFNRLSIISHEHSVLSEPMLVTLNISCWKKFVAKDRKGEGGRCDFSHNLRVNIASKSHF